MDQEPLNISLVDTDVFIKKHGCQQVTSNLIKEVSTGTFHPDGLYSERIFGEVTSTERLTRFGFIDLHARIVHPKVFRNIIRLKRFFGQIVAGQEYAVFDKATSMFVRANNDDPNANTGYSFFMKYLLQLKFDESFSLTRDDRIEILKRYKEKIFTNKWLVIPAGIRDYKMDENGSGTTEEINKLYNSLLNYSRAVDPGNSENPAFDTIRYAIQRKCCEIFDYIENILAGPEGGKRGFLQKKYGSRNVALGARNIISSSAMGAESPDDPKFHDIDTTKVPLLTAAHIYKPVVIYQIRHSFLHLVLNHEADQISLIDPQSLRLTYQPITEKQKDLFASSAGISKLINLFQTKDFRHNPVTVLNEKGKPFYIYLVYDDNDQIYIFRNIEEFKQAYKETNTRAFDENKVRPLTYVEMFYISTYFASRDKYVTITRYPAVGLNSIYSSKVYLMSTSPARKVILKSEYVPAGMELLEYPIIGKPFIDSTIPHPSKLQGLGADFDGDSVNNIGVMNGRSLKENEEYFKSKASVLSPSGKLALGASTDTLKLVFFNLSWLPEQK